MQIAKILVSVFLVLEAALATGFILFAAKYQEAKSGQAAEGLILLLCGVMVLHLGAVIGLFHKSTKAKLVGGLCGAPIACIAGKLPWLAFIWIAFYGVLVMDWYSSETGTEESHRQIGSGSSGNTEQTETSSEYPVQSTLAGDVPVNQNGETLPVAGKY